MFNVVFTHDTEMALQAAARLANSADEPDTLDAVATLDAYFVEFEYTGRHDRTRDSSTASAPSGRPSGGC